MMTYDSTYTLFMVWIAQYYIVAIFVETKSVEHKDKSQNSTCSGGRLVGSKQISLKLNDAEWGKLELIPCNTHRKILHL